MSSSSLVTYYAARAAVYEQVYDKPERQADLARLRQLLPALLAGRQILELACGTGYWTRVLAATAASIDATDINEEVLAIARATPLPAVQYIRDDAARLSAVAGTYDAGFAGFWWSHIPVAQLPAALDVLHRRLTPGSRVVWLDNLYVAGSNQPVTSSDAAGNTYQRRTLPNGDAYEVLKNFPTEAELRAVLGPLATDISYTQLSYYWLVSYTLPAEEPAASRG